MAACKPNVLELVFTHDHSRPIKEKRVCEPSGPVKNSNLNLNTLSFTALWIARVPVLCLRTYMISQMRRIFAQTKSLKQNQKNESWRRKKYGRGYGRIIIRSKLHALQRRNEPRLNGGGGGVRAALRRETHCKRQRVTAQRTLSGGAACEVAAPQFPLRGSRLLDGAACSMRSCCAGVRGRWAAGACVPTR